MNNTVRVRLDGSTQPQDAYLQIEENYVDIEYKHIYTDKVITMNEYINENDWWETDTETGIVSILMNKDIPIRYSLNGHHIKK